MHVGYIRRNFKGEKERSMPYFKIVMAFFKAFMFQCVRLATMRVSRVPKMTVKIRPFLESQQWELQRISGHKIKG